MSRSQIPQSLRVSPGTLVRFDPDSGEETVGFFPRPDYLLVEIYGRGQIKLYGVRQIVRRYLEEAKRPVGIRGFGPRGISLSVTICHLLQLDAGERFWEHPLFDTFSVQAPKQKKMTACQIVLVPKGG